MNIKELKQLIKDLPEDSSISFLMDSGCCGDFEEMECYDTSVYDGVGIAFRLESLPGYGSCRQAANTIEKNESK